MSFVESHIHVASDKFQLVYRHKSVGPRKNLVASNRGVINYIQLCNSTYYMVYIHVICIWIVYEIPRSLPWKSLDGVDISLSASSCSRRSGGLRSKTWKAPQPNLRNTDCISFALSNSSIPTWKKFEMQNMRWGKQPIFPCMKLSKVPFFVRHGWLKGIPAKQEL